MTRQEVVDALIAERYAKPTWWRTPPTEHPEHPGATPNFDDSELNCAARRKALAADFKALESRGPVDRCG